MILKGSQRGGASQLAAHLLNARDNEHVEVHELRGFSADDLRGAFQEIDATSRGTRAKQPLFSLSLNPPPREHVSTAAFEAAIDAAEKKLGLQGQPRAIVFHEKEGRRHAHVVWSRIDAECMKALNLPHFKRKLQDVSRQLYREHGWDMPRGLVNSQHCDPLNFTHAEWEQAKKAQQDPRALKSMFQQGWADAPNAEAYKQTLAERGYTLAHGDRRAFVAMDFRGQVFAVAKWSNVKTKEVRAKLDTLKDIPSVEQAKATIAASYDRGAARLRCRSRNRPPETGGNACYATGATGAATAEGTRRTCRRAGTAPNEGNGPACQPPQSGHARPVVTCPL